MSKDQDMAELLGTDKPAVKKAAAKKAAPAKADAKPAAKKAAPAKAEVAVKAKPAAKKAAAEDKPARVKEPVVFEEGEREALIKRVKTLVKKPINSKDLAVKLDIATRKLRRVLYSAQKQGVIALELSESKAAGMTVSPV